MQALGSGIAHFLLRLWRIVRWPIGLLFAAFVVAVLYVLVMTPTWSKEAIKEINAQHLTVRDVDGTNLPPTPDQTKVDATVQGVDANDNGIRDDVELAIFKKYPNDMKLRAAALQYAMTEQSFLSGKIVDKASWKAAAEQDSRASSCIDERDLSFTETEALDHWVEGLVTNTPARKAKYESVFKYTTSFGDGPRPFCDVVLK